VVADNLSGRYSLRIAEELNKNDQLREALIEAASRFTDIADLAYEALDSEANAQDEIRRRAVRSVILATRDGKLNPEELKTFFKLPLPAIRDVVEEHWEMINDGLMENVRLHLLTYAFDFPKIKD
jgi:hypothetical protein